MPNRIEPDPFSYPGPSPCLYPSWSLSAFTASPNAFTWAPHFWLGVSLMLAPVGTWIAICPTDGSVLSPVALVLGLAVLLWVGGFDIIYACQDIKYDQRDGLYSLPARLGVPLSLWISRTCHCLTITDILKR